MCQITDSSEYKAVPVSPTMPAASNDLEDGGKAASHGVSPACSLPCHIRLFREIREQSRTSIPTMAGMLLYKIPWMLSLRFVGRIGSEELAAAALATTLCNVTGLSLSVGLSSALSTLTGQSRGDLLSTQSTEKETLVDHDDMEADNNDDGPSSLLSTANMHQPVLPLMYLYRGIFIQLLFVVPVGLWWLSGIKPTLLFLGQGEVLSSMTEKYLRILTPGLWSYSINWTLTAWLQAIEMADVPAYAASVGLILHVPLNLLFIYGLGWGYLGVGLATVAFQLIQPVLIVGYLFRTRHGRSRVLENTGAATIGRETLSGWTEIRLAMSSLSGIAQYLSLALPGIVLISEWWASEVVIFLSGTLAPNPDLALSGMTIYQSINAFCFMFPKGCSISGSARVGKFLGQGEPKLAAVAANAGVLCASCLSAIIGGILYLTPHSTFPSFFSPDYEVVKQARMTIPLLALYVFADGVQNSLNGVIQGCGRQCITMPIVVVAYWIVGVPLAYYFVFVRNDGYMCTDDKFCGVVGLVSGMTIGTWVHCLLLAVVVYGTTRWKVEAERAKERLRVDKAEHGMVPAISSPLSPDDDEFRGMEMLCI